MAKAYDAMSEAELAELTEQALREHESGTAPFQTRGEAASQTVRTTSLSLRLPAPLFDQIRAVAAARGVSYQRLMVQWLEEALEREPHQVAP